MATSTFLHHIPCLTQDEGGCGSSDAAGAYSDGTAKCHGCGKRWNLDGSTTKAEPKKSLASGLLEVDIRPLKARGISQETCEKFGYGIGYMGGKPVQVAPYHDLKGLVVGQKTRTANKDFRYLGSKKSIGLFGQHLCRLGGKILVITEGEIDCLSVSQVQQNKWPVVSVPFGSGAAAQAVAQNLEFCESFERVVIMFDMDDPGQKAAQEVAEVLSPGKAHIASLGLKDPNALLQAGRGREILDAMWGAKVYRPDGIVEGVDLWEKLMDQTPIPSTSYPFPELQALTLGWRDGEVVVVGAGTKVGKSTWIKEVAYHVGMQGVRVGIVALEEQDATSARGLMAIHVNKPLNVDPKAISPEEYREAFDEVMPHFAFYDHFGSLNPDRLIGKIRYLIKGCGCTRIILDHLSIVVSGDVAHDERRVIDKLMTDLASLGQETGAGIMVVSHLSRASGQGKSYEEGRHVTLASFRGSGAIAQIGFDLIGLERNLQGGVEKNQGQMRLLACRYTGESGLAGGMEYDKDTGRLLPSESMVATTGDLSEFE